MDKTTASKSLKNRPTTLKLEYPKKTAAPVLAHRDGREKELTHKLEPIVPLLRAAVKAAAVALGIYLLAAVAALNLLAALAALLAENALLGAWFALGEVQA